MIRALAIALLVAPSASFVAQFGSGPRAVALSAAKGKGLANDAIAVFRAKYDKPPMKIPGIFSNSMIGENSIAAEMYGKSSKSLTSTEYIPFSERPEKDLVACFNEMAKLYGGEENALKIVKAEPCSLAYNPSNFAATKKAFLCALTEDKVDEKGKVSNLGFSPADVEAMVIRNPLLLGVRPDGFGGASNTKEDTVYMSYIIAATRPAGPFLLATLFLLLLTPGIKSILGIE